MIDTADVRECDNQVSFQFDVDLLEDMAKCPTQLDFMSSDNNSVSTFCTTRSRFTAAPSTGKTSSSSAIICDKAAQTL